MMEKSLTTIPYCDNLKLSLIPGEDIARLVLQIDAEVGTLGRRNRARGDQICARPDRSRATSRHSVVERSERSLRPGERSAAGGKGSRPGAFDLHDAPRTGGLPDLARGAAQGVAR